MSTAAVTPDPYASIAKPLPQRDPYAAIAKPIAPPPPAEKSLWQKAKDNFNANTQGAAPNDGAVLGAVKNFGAGAGDFVRAVAHPIDTIESMVSTPDPAWAALSHFAGDDRAMQEIAKQPKGSVVRTLGQLGAGVLAGEAGGAVVDAVAPTVRSAASRALLLGKTPAEAYESAMKPSTTLSQADRGELVQTGLENSIPVSKAGFAKLSSQIHDLDNTRAAVIASDPTRPINTVGAVRNLDSVRARFANQVTPQDDLAEIDHVQKNFLTNPKIAPQGAGPSPSSLPAADAQAMKSGTYQALGDKSFGELKGANIEAQKALARGIKDEIAVQFPELKNLNATESKLLDLQPVLERAVNRIGNHQLIGIGTPAAGVAATAVTGVPAIGDIAMAIKGVLDHPAVKSRIAIAVSKGAGIPYSQAVARVAAYSSALQSSAGAPQAYSSADNPSQPTTQQP